MKYSTQLNARIPLSTFREIKSLSKKKRITFSEAVRIMLEKGISITDTKKTTKRKKRKYTKATTEFVLAG